MAELESDATERAADLVRVRGGAAGRRYAELSAGRSSLGAAVRYDLVTGLFGGMRGAAGYWLRRWVYRLILGGLGHNVTIGPNVTLRGASRIVLGDDVFIDESCMLDARGADASIRIGRATAVSRNTVIRARGGKVEIGEGCSIGCNCILGTDSRLIVGRKVLIAAYVYLTAGGNHRFSDSSGPVIDQGVVKKGGIEVGDGAWLGTRSTVLDGVSIGRGAVVGAHSLVRESLPALCIAYGVPACAKRYRHVGECDEEV